ncbi:MAG: glycosyltransferase, partial [Calditrichaeota bacterium]|nr:glycosyltransferase [Calditrichota bacterium]
HSHYADAGYVGTRLSHQLGIPLVHTGHSLGRSKRQRLLASGMKGAAIEARYNMSRRITAEEETLGSAVQVITSTHQEIEEQYAQYDYYQPEKMRVIPPGTDLKRFYPPDGTEWESPIAGELAKFLRDPQKPIVLALSRPDQRKNIHTLVEAFGASPALREAANLVVVAGNREDISDMDGGPQEVLTDMLLTIDRFNLYGQVAYPKKHLPDEVPVLYRLAALSGGAFINPALTEPFGLTLIEAAACGLPIVATEDGGPVDIIKNCRNGYLIDPLEPAAMAETLLKVLADRPHWEVLAENGKKGVAENYTWHSHVARYLETLAPIVAQTQRPDAPSPKRRRLYHLGAVVSDIDQNLLGDPDSLTRLVEVIHQRRSRFAFCIATGRRLDSALKVLRKHRIPQPEVLMTSMGTEIYYSPELSRDLAWTNHIDYLWNRRAVRRLLEALPGLSLQPKIEQSAYKLSYYYDPENAPSVEEINQILLQNDQTVNVIFGFGQFLDIVPVRASKGYALRWFLEQWDIPLDHVLTAGGTGADEDLMRGNTLSVVVANRHHDELANLADIEPIYFSEKQYAAGILDGLAHYRFFERCGDGND